MYNSIINENSHHFDALFEIIKRYPEVYFAEGNIWFEGGGNTDISPRFEHKRQTLFKLAQNATRILEIGFNAGHSSLLMLLANPKNTIHAFDIGEHEYTKYCFEYLETTFPGRIKITYGDSTKTLPAFINENTEKEQLPKYDLLHVDGGHDEHIMIQDVHNCRWLADPQGHILIVDDDLLPRINWWNRRWLQQGYLLPLDEETRWKIGNIHQGGGESDQFIATYNLSCTAAREIVIARYNRDLAWAQPLSEMLSIVVYNKGSDNIPGSFGSFAALKTVPNVGMDQASHLQYIVDNYDRLPDIVLFAQDDLDDHIHDQNTMNIYNTINLKYHTTEDYIRVLFEEAKRYGHSINAFEYEWVGGAFSPSYEFKVDPNYGEQCLNETYGQWFEKNIRTPFPDGPRFLWFKNAIFAVQRKFILSRPKSDYVALLKQFVHSRSELNHFMERSWYYLLNMDRCLDDVANYTPPNEKCST